MPGSYRKLTQVAVEEMRRATSRLMPQLINDLQSLVRIPSISFPGFPDAPLHEAAATIASMLQDADLPDARLLEVPEAPPCVYAHRPATDGAATVVLYAHYDVQPVGDEDLWTTPPFDPAVRGGRLNGRGAADDKSGIAMHLGALRLLGESGLGIKVLFEGKEECGHGELNRFVEADPGLVAGDVFLMTDQVNYALGVPTLTTSTRGLVNVEVEVRALRRAVHSGVYGGAAPDALVALVRMLATLHDSKGNVTVEGLSNMACGGTTYDEEDFRDQAGVLPGVELIGEGALSERLAARPSISFHGLDAPAVDSAGNALVPRARALVGVRIAPEQDPEEAFAAVTRHLHAVRPWNVELSIDRRMTAEGFVGGSEGPVFDSAREALAMAFGRAAKEMGGGGAIPFLSTYAKLVPDADIIFFGAMEPLCNIHGIDESVDLGELERWVLAEGLFLHALGGRTEYREARPQLDAPASAGVANCHQADRG